MRMRSDITAILILGAAVAAIVVVMFATGWADDKAPPGSGSRGGAVSVSSASPAQTTK
ncbi:MAG TPA: hypothetical protein VGO71_11880 [Baekduia sp.]|jgi:hypothetical protein|nr:hypothetical protein [Baekduia sp.]